MSPADSASRAGDMPEASGDSSSGTLGTMKHLPLLIIAVIANVSCIDGAEPDADALANRDWEINYTIDRPSSERPKFLSPPWKIQELAANSSRVSLTLWQDGTMNFLEPGLDDGDNPLKLSSSETKKILTAACRLLQSDSKPLQKTEAKDIFTISVELRIGDSRFQYLDRTFRIDSQLPSDVFNLIQTMQPYSPAWTKTLKR